MGKATCPRCGESKAHAEFYRDSSQSSGRKSHCKACVLESRRDHWLKHGHTIAAKRRAERSAVRQEGAAIPEVRECPGCDRTLPASAFFRDAGRPDGLSTPCRECKEGYRAERPESWWRADYMKRVRKHGIEPVVESFTRADIVRQQGGERCADCGASESALTLDHRRPVLAGGAHALWNVALVCFDCNMRKLSDSDRAEIRAYRDLKEVMFG